MTVVMRLRYLCTPEGFPDHDRTPCEPKPSWASSYGQLLDHERLQDACRPRTCLALIYPSPSCRVVLDTCCPDPPPPPGASLPLF